MQEGKLCNGGGELEHISIPASFPPYCIPHCFPQPLCTLPAPMEAGGGGQNCRSSCRLHPWNQSELEQCWVAQGNDGVYSGGGKHKGTLMCSHFLPPPSPHPIARFSSYNSPYLSQWWQKMAGMQQGWGWKGRRNADVFPFPPSHCKVLF